MPAATGGIETEFGVYVHIPFCSKRCGYCAFATSVGKLDLAPDYVDACIADITRAKKDGSLPRPTTVFVGGGTPSLLPEGFLERLLGAIDPAPGAEVTVEANPESATQDFFSEAKRSGVTRISLGAQSLAQHVLFDLDRTHTPGAVAGAVRAIGEVGFPTFNLDLIYGSVAESDADLAATLEEVLYFEPSPPHVSAYALTVEAGTLLSRDPTRHPDDDVLARRYEMVDDRLRAAGLDWYEISNWARPGHECRHNLACWRGAEYLGFGCAAHSHFAGERFANVSSPERYIERVRTGRSPVAWTERLEPDARALELLELSLRTRNGVRSAALDEGDPLLADLVSFGEGRAVLTRKGRLLANEVAIRLRVGAADGPPQGAQPLAKRA